MTSVEIPYSIAAALPTLSVLDITNEVAREIRSLGAVDGIAYVTPTDPASVVRVNERESGFFCDLEDLLLRIVPNGARDRERLLMLLLGPRTEQVPFRGEELCLGTYQRVLLFTFGGHRGRDWTLTLLG